MRTVLRYPKDYAGEVLCPRCGNGWPVCADFRPDGSPYSHMETCARYRYGADVCATCEAEMETEGR